MYFQEKGNTNIDDQFKGNKRIKINKKNNKNTKNKKTLFIVIGIIALIAIIVIILILNGNKTRIELLGDSNMTIILGNDYIEPGYIAYDKDGNNITSKIEVTSNIDTSKEGEYEVLYSIKNVTEVRYIKVVKTEVYIHLLGKQNMYLEVGEKYVEPGYNVYGEANLKDKVKVTGKVNTSKTGTYQLTYTVVTSNNVTVTKARMVTVVEKGKKPTN